MKNCIEGFFSRLFRKNQCDGKETTGTPSQKTTPDPVPEQFVVFPPVLEDSSVPEPHIEESEPDNTEADTFVPAKQPEFVEVDNITVGNQRNVVESDVNAENVENKTDDRFFLNLDKMVHGVVDLIGFYDGYAASAPADVKALYEDVSEKLIELLIDAGAEPINAHSGLYDPAFHRGTTGKTVKKGTPFVGLVRQGAIWNEEVLVCARVTIKQE